MKRFLSLFFIFIFSLSLCSSVFADELASGGDHLSGPDPPSDSGQVSDPDSPSDAGQVSDPDPPSDAGQIPDSDSVLLPDVDPSSGSTVVYGDTDSMSISGDYVLDGVSVYSVVSPVTPSSTTGLKSVLLSLLGNYDPIVVEYRYLNNSSSSYGYLRDVQPDYVWICSFFMFLVVVFCVFRLGGGLIGRS